MRRFLDRLRHLSPWWVAALALGVGGVIAVPQLGHPDFYTAFIATYIGAALGFFVALYTDRLQRGEDLRRSQTEAAEAEKRARAEEEATTRAHRVAVLTLLRAELGRIPNQMGQSRQNRAYPPGDRMSDILWRAMSAAGELRWVTDLQLLQEVASAYDLLAVEIDLERGWWEARALAPTGTAPLESHYANQLRQYDNDLWRLACRACRAMDSALVADAATPGGDMFCPS